MLCIGRVKKVEKWKSVVEKLGGTVRADVLHTCGDCSASEEDQIAKTN